jgi:ornithine decarboxylase
MKCNSDEKICRVLAQAGCGFDCASKGEIILAQELGVTSENIIYANPCKQANMLRYAREVGVRLMTADNVEELHKIRDIFPEARIVLRIAVDDSKSVCRFNSKFGAPPAEWDAFLSTAKELALDVAGVSFHVGSGCGDLQPFADAVASARDCFDLMSTRYGFSPNYLDIGGGWPGHDKGNFTFKDVAAVVAEAIDNYFPASSGVEIVAEPGRYFAHASHTYAVTVIAKRQLSKAQLADTAEIESFGARPTKNTEDTISSHADDGFKKAEASENQPEVALYINDGVYGCFNCVVFDHAHVFPKALEPRSSARTVNTKLFGPTCDSIDVVMPSTRLPEMRVGEWLWFDGMGAYTRCAASRFNGQGAFDIHYVWAGMP